MGERTIFTAPRLIAGLLFKIDKVRFTGCVTGSVSAQVKWLLRHMSVQGSGNLYRDAPHVACAVLSQTRRSKFTTISFQRKLGSSPALSYEKQTNQDLKAQI